MELVSLASSHSSKMYVFVIGRFKQLLGGLPKHNQLFASWLLGDRKQPSCDMFLQKPAVIKVYFSVKIPNFAFSTSGYILYLGNTAWNNPGGETTKETREYCVTGWC